MRRQRITRTAATALLGASALLAAACGPAPGPGVATPTWHATRLARTVTPTETVNHSGAWTDDSWFATVRVLSPIGGSTSGELRIHPRTGPGGGTLGDPQTLALPPDTGAAGPIGDHIIAVPTASGAAFYAETDGSWAAAGSVTVPAGYQVATMTDSWMTARRIPTGSPGAGPATVEVYRVQRIGSTVTATPHTHIHPDTGWSTGHQENFGWSIAFDGDLMAVTALSGTAAGPLVQLYRNLLDDWHPVQTIGDTIALQRQTGAMAVDDGPTVDRIVLSPFITSLQPPSVDVWADIGTGFAPEQNIALDPGLADASGGNLFGSSVAIDGDVLAVTARSSQVASVRPGHPPVTVGHVQLYRHSVAWTAEQEVPTFDVPYDAGVRQSLPHRLQVAGDHVAVTMLVSPDEPPGCVFPCFVIGFEAYALDRY